MRPPRFGSLPLAIALLLVVAGCAGDDTASSTEDPTVAESAATSEAEETAAPTETMPAEETDTSTEAGAEVTLADAEQAALDHVGDGEVTWSGPEDDRGAAWEVEITRPDGSEVDVLVAADGSIVKQVEKYTGTPEATPPAPPSGELTLADAEQIAVAAVGGGVVTWSGDEDERGARWEVEVTRPDGSEVDVLIDAEGNVVS